MTAHITHHKPSLLKQLLNFVGLIDLHTKVNCWFCNQDSYILPGTKNTVDFWHCYLCDNVNQRDRNGIIQDPKQFEVEPPSHNLPRSRSQPTQAEPQQSSSRGRSLCYECQKLQVWIYEELARYIPDESDPTFQERLDSADEHSRRLHATHPICNDCQALIDTIVKEQRELFKTRTMNGNLHIGQEEIPEIRPSPTRYYSEAIVWYHVHLLTLLFIIYCTVLPPTGNIFDSFNMDIVFRLYAHIKDMVTTKENDWHLVFDCLYTSLLNTISSYENRAVCFFTNDSTMNCTWSVQDYLVSVLIFNLMSLYSFDWHPKLRRWFTKDKVKKVRNLSIYKNLQVVMFLYRNIIVSLANSIRDKRMMASCGVVYVTLVIISYSIVRSSELILPQKPIKVNKENTEESAQDQQPIEDVEMTDAEDFSVSQQTSFNTSLDSSSVATPNNYTNENDITEDPMDIDVISNGLNNIRV